METSRSAAPLVSICIPVYNAEATIERTLASVTGQTYRNMEIIVVDNLSTDRTLEIVRTFSDSRIRIVENPVHFGCGEDNWNTCFAHSSGKFMALFHADDVYTSEMVARQVETFQKNPGVVGVFTNADIIDEHDNVVNSFKFPPEIAGNTPYTYQDLLPAVLKHDNFLLCSSAMIHGDLYHKLAPFRYNLFGHASDLDMWLRVAREGPVIFLDKSLMKYRTGTTGWSINLKSSTQQRDFFRVMDFHIAENGTGTNLSSDTLAMYELRRMEDQIFLALNLVKKHDFSGFREHLIQMAWKKYLRVIILKPRISLPVLFRGFFKMVKNLFPK
ncbi:MAG: glycosyltransferase [Methanoregula sp.]|nr:glycosyltransferase [Methanoregula sp.]